MQAGEQHRQHTLLVLGGPLAGLLACPFRTILPGSVNYQDRMISWGYLSVVNCSSIEVSSTLLFKVTLS